MTERPAVALGCVLLAAAFGWGLFFGFLIGLALGLGS